MKKMKEKIKRLKRETEALCEYVQVLSTLLERKIHSLYYPPLFLRNLLMALKKLGKEHNALRSG